MIRSLAPGQIVIVLGRNGAGKSTLLHRGRPAAPGPGPVTGTGPTRVGWVPERFPADQPFTVGGYLAPPSARRPVCDGPVDRARWSTLGRAARAWRHSVAAARWPSCPRAPRRRSAWRRHSLTAPDLLVLDEPWEGLDAAAAGPGTGRSSSRSRRRAARCWSAITAARPRGCRAPDLAGRPDRCGRSTPTCRDCVPRPRSVPRGRRSSRRGARPVTIVERYARRPRSRHRSGCVVTGALVRMRLAGYVRAGRRHRADAGRPDRDSASCTAAAWPGPARRTGCRRSCCSRCSPGRRRSCWTPSPTCAPASARSCGRPAREIAAGLLAAAIVGAVTVGRPAWCCRGCSAASRRTGTRRRPSPRRCRSPRRWRSGCGRTCWRSRRRWRSARWASRAVTPDRGGRGLCRWSAAPCRDRGRAARFAGAVARPAAVAAARWQPRVSPGVPERWWLTGVTSLAWADLVPAGTGGCPVRHVRRVSGPDLAGCRPVHVSLATDVPPIDRWSPLPTFESAGRRSAGGRPAQDGRMRSGRVRPCPPRAPCAGAFLVLGRACRTDQPEATRGGTWRTSRFGPTRPPPSPS